MKRRRLGKRQRIFRAGAAKSAAIGWGPASTESEIVRIIREHIRRRSRIDRDGLALDDVNRISG